MDAVTPVRPSNPMHRFRHGYGKVLEWVVGTLMIILAIEVTIGVVFRWLGNSLVWYDETASLLLAWLTFYGSALASVRRAHIGCPEVVESLGPRGRRYFNIVAQLLVIAFFALLGWMGLEIMPILAGDTLVSLPWVPVNFVHSAIPISAALILIAEVMHLIDLIRTPDDENTASALSDGLI
ncbi:TRAP transporter small permease [Pollutimonas harenae]|uniref:TRAP transporter small permease protein n=1 Tax=Pollutimonas harenae TaxID=657015 RepID=A0A853H0S3_9BURK|nr:TRAP transporter small permease [Pollutimonas harenae]NYT85630.1 TRAP transporter small permease [Pollutimonas harenae]TEA70707.1 TRAP transporter small permease [Pollutimonas harenae]